MSDGKGVVVLRVANPIAFGIPSIRDLLLKTFRTHTLADPNTEAVLAELQGWIENPRVALLISRKDGHWCACALCEVITSLLNPGVWVAHFYSEGYSDVREALLRAIEQFAREHGQTRVIGVDMNGTSRAFARLFKSLGTPTFVGDMVAFNLRDENERNIRIERIASES